METHAFPNPVSIFLEHIAGWHFPDFLWLAEAHVAVFWPVEIGGSDVYHFQAWSLKDPDPLCSLSSLFCQQDTRPWCMAEPLGRRWLGPCITALSEDLILIPVIFTGQENEEKESPEIWGAACLGSYPILTKQYDWSHRSSVMRQWAQKSYVTCSKAQKLVRPAEVYPVLSLCETVCWLIYAYVI